MLIDSRVYDKSKSAILNILPGGDRDNVERICEELDLNLTFAPKGGQCPSGIDVILDEGAFGWSHRCIF